VKIALIQKFCCPDKNINVREGLSAVEQAVAHGAQVICFAELAFESFYPQKPARGNIINLAETIPGPTTDAFSNLAAKHGIVIVINLFERDGTHTFDSSPVIDADGKILGVTRMVHITDYSCFHEKGYYTPGDRGAPVYQTRFGRIGVAICYDRHYPEYMRALALNGAEIAVIPQAGVAGEWPEGLYEAEMRVAAFQNGYFTVLCNRVGKEEYLTFAGESFVCNPAGEVIARAVPGSEEILYCYIDLNQVSISHAKKLFFRDRRPELYSEWFK